MRRVHPVIRVGLLSFAALAVIVSVASGGTLPHLHDEAGWWNEEHDLILLATANPSLLLPVAASVVTTAVVTPAWTSVVVAVAEPSVRPRDARAPPTA